MTDESISIDTGTGELLCSIRDRVAIITLNRPDRMNAWTAIMERDVRHAMELAAGDDDVRVIDGRFMEIRQAMGTPQGRPAAAAYLQSFIEEMKASGFVADALNRSNQPDAAVAPAGG